MSNPQSNEINEIITRLRNIGTEAYNEAYKVHGSNDYERVGLQMELEDKIAEEAKAKLEALIRARQIEELDRFVKNCSERKSSKETWEAWSWRVVHYLQGRFSELKGKEK